MLACSELSLSLFLQMENAPLGNREVYLFSKGSLSLQTHFFPWKNGSLYKRSSRWAQMLDGSGEQERPQKDRPSCFCRHREELLLLPLYAGPFIHLWRRCYLRGNHKVQVKILSWFGKESRVAFVVPGLQCCVYGLPFPPDVGIQLSP